MIQEALEGKIDLIITKSISRFARNTVDALVNIRKLKEHNVEVYFEKENIYTFDSTGELMLSLLSSLAQEESRSISQNTIWGKRKSFADGRVSVGYKNFLGYDKGENGKMVVNKEQAEVVKKIYKMYLLGFSFYNIAKTLQEQKIKSPSGKDRWHATTVRSILMNEKFKGDALLQKQYTADFLTKKRIINKGEVAQYYVNDDHEAIIEKKTFDLVQAEMQKRKTDVDTHYSCVNEYANKIVCGECGGFFGRKVWHSNDKYKAVVYRCNNKYKNNGKCNTGKITEAEIQSKFVTAFNELYKQRGEVIKNAQYIIEKMSDISKEEKEIKELTKQLNGLAEKSDIMINDNARKKQDQEKYNLEYSKLTDEYNKIQARIDKIKVKILEKNSRVSILKGYLEELKSQKMALKTFDKVLWCSLVDKMIVYNDKTVIKWNDGIEVTV